MSEMSGIFLSFDILCLAHNFAFTENKSSMYDVEHVFSYIIYLCSLRKGLKID